MMGRGLLDTEVFGSFQELRNRPMKVDVRCAA